MLGKAYKVLYRSHSGFYQSQGLREKILIPETTID